MLFGLGWEGPLQYVWVVQLLSDGLGGPPWEFDTLTIWLLLLRVVWMWFCDGSGLELLLVGGGCCCGCSCCVCPFNWFVCGRLTVLRLRECMLLGAKVKVHSWPSMGKYGILFSGRHESREMECLWNLGQLPLLVLVWWEEVPHETQCGSSGWLQSFVACGHTHVAHLSSLAHCSQIWPYCWHLLQHMGSWMSLLTTIHELVTKIHWVRWLAASGDVQVSFTFAVFWLCFHSARFLIQAAEIMEPSSSPWSLSSTLS